MVNLETNTVRTCHPSAVKDLEKIGFVQQQIEPIGFKMDSEKPLTTKKKKDATNNRTNPEVTEIGGENI